MNSPENEGTIEPPFPTFTTESRNSDNSFFLTTYVVFLFLITCMIL
jgi:hypothetical protein